MHRKARVPVTEELLRDVLHIPIGLTITDAVWDDAASWLILTLQGHALPHSYYCKEDETPRTVFPTVHHVEWEFPE